MRAVVRVCVFQEGDVHHGTPKQKLDAPQAASVRWDGTGEQPQRLEGGRALVDQLYPVLVELVTVRSLRVRKAVQALLR